MIKSVLFIFVAVASVQSAIYAPSYPQPCSCGKPALPAMPAIVPASPPYAAATPISMQLLAAPYEMPLPGPRANVPLISAPCEVPMALPATMPNAPILAAPLPANLPIGLPVNLPLGLPAPGPIPKVLAKPACGCFETAVPEFELSLPIGNPFLPAASPVSAMAPFSMLPPACPCSRCQYLKKIPIPPPCI